jgi:hypothetical protein
MKLMTTQLEFPAREDSIDSRIDTTEKIVKEICKIVSVNVKLLKLLVDDRIDIKEYNKIHKKNERSIQTMLKYRDFTKQSILEEISIKKSNLEEAYNKKDIIEVRKKIGDILEQEYNLKIRAILWDVNNYDEEIKALETSLEKLDNFKIYLQNEVLDDLVGLSNKNYQTIDNANLTNAIKNQLKKEIEFLNSFISSS